MSSFYERTADPGRRRWNKWSRPVEDINDPRLEEKILTELKEDAIDIISKSIDVIFEPIVIRSYFFSLILVVIFG